MLVVDGSAVSPAAVLAVQAFGVSIGLLVARFVLVSHGPAAAVGAHVAPAPPVPFRALCAWTGAALLDRAIPLLPLLAVLVFAAPLDALAYAMAWRVSALLDAGLLVHAVVRPAVAVVTGSVSGSVSADSASTLPVPSHLLSMPVGVASRAVSGALWWMLMFALVMTGPLLALDSYAAVLFDVLVPLFGDLLRVFVLARLGVVALGPGAEVLEVSGHHVRRFGIVARVALPVVVAAGFS